MLQKITKIEYAKALKDVKAISSNKDFLKILDIVVPNDLKEEVVRSINGLSEEDEYAIITKIIGTSNFLVNFGQRPIFSNDLQTPDFLVNYDVPLISKEERKQIGGTLFLVEVKSTKSNSFKIGGSKLKKLRNFSSFLKLPLLFAIKFIDPKPSRSIWSLFSDDITNSNISFSKDQFSILKDILWKDYQCIINSQVKIHYKSSTISNKKTIIVGDFGTLEEIMVELGTHKFTRKTPAALFDAMLFDCFDLKEIRKVQISSHEYAITLVPQKFKMTLSDLIIEMNNLLVEMDEEKFFNPTKLLTQIDQNNFQIIDRKIVETRIGELMSLNIIKIEKNYNT